MCRFGRFDLGSVPKARRRQATSLRIQQWSPFARSGSCVVFDEDAAVVWIWDRDRVDRDIEAARLKQSRVAVMPETLLRGAAADGSRLVTCLSGVEGQVWQRGQLVHSRWWAGAPDLSGWNAFLRDGGQPAASAAPTPHSIQLSEKPWASIGNLVGGDNWRHEGTAVIAGVSILLAATTWNLMHWAQISNRVQDEKAHLADLERRAQPLQMARQQALESLERIEFLRGLDLYPAQPLLLAEAGKRLPRDGTFIKEWDFQGGRLRLALVSPAKLQASALVKAYQEAGWFKDVQAASSNDPNALVLEMTVLKLGDIERIPDLLNKKG